MSFMKSRELAFKFYFLFQIKWLNDYNAEIRQNMGPEINRQGKQNVYEYMIKETEPFRLPSVGSGANAYLANYTYIILAANLMTLLLHFIN